MSFDRQPTFLVPLLFLLAAACEQVVDPSNLPPPDRYIDIRQDEVSEPASDIPAESEMLEEVIEDIPAEDVMEEEAVVVEDCTIDLDTFSPPERAAFNGTYGFWLVQGAISSGFGTDPFSLLDIESWTWDGGPTTVGTYEITERISTRTCALCVFVCEGCPASTPQCSSCDHKYVATRGTVEITDLTVGVGGTVQGTLTDAYLAEVDWTADTLIPGGRGACVDFWSFDQVQGDHASW